MAAAASPPPSWEACVAGAEPLVLAIAPKYFTDYCNYCLKKLRPQMRKRCARCEVAHYCSRECQSTDWPLIHKRECANVDKHRFDVLRMMDTMSFASDIGVNALLLFRLVSKFEAGTLQNERSPLSRKKFGSLPAHKALMEKANIREHYERVVNIVKNVYGGGFRVDDATLFNLYCQLRMNSLPVEVWSAASDATPTSIGLCIHIDYSAYKHSCRPTIQPFWAGRTLRFVPLPDAMGAPVVDAHDFNVAKLARTDLCASRGVRHRNLLDRWNIDCECERCTSDDDLLLSAICCSSCARPIPVDDRKFTDGSLDMRDPKVCEIVDRIRLSVPKEHADQLKLRLEQIGIAEERREKKESPKAAKPALPSMACPECGSAQPTHWLEKGLTLMTLLGLFFACEKQMLDAEMPGGYIKKSLSGPEHSALCAAFVRECDRLLPDCNIFYMSLQADMALSSETPHRDYLLRSSYDVVRRCYPHGHAKRFRYALRTCAALVECGRAADAGSILDELELEARQYFGWGLMRGTTLTPAEFADICPFADRLVKLRALIAVALA